ncbi:hypothetical protein [Streptomyces sp. NBC_01304]|uniref:hypothetical protein n=1 Tax=Streptomyces sp. NBC_01304 TaxID=2903818 RepID=UPI003FA3A126
MSEQRQDDVPVPARIAPHFVLVEAELVVALGTLEALLDCHVETGDRHQLLDGGADGYVSNGRYRWA